MEYIITLKQRFNTIKGWQWSVNSAIVR